MAITINSNISSLTTQRRLGNTTAELGRSYERLSSGLRINRANDDAAGLAMADGLGVDARLTSQALRNVNDGLSVTAVISSALGQQQQILGRMAELAEQSANGVLQASQRDALQQEYAALIAEFDRIAETTQFNGISLLKNPSGSVSISIGKGSSLSLPAVNSHSYAGVYGLLSNFDGDTMVTVADFVPSLEVAETTAEDIEAGLADERLNFGKVTFTDSSGRTGVLTFSASRALGDVNQTIPLDLEPSSLTFVGFAETTDGSETTGGVTGTLSLENREFSAYISYGLGATAQLEFDFTGTEFLSFQAGVAIRETAIGFTNITAPVFARNSLETIGNRSEDLSLLQAEIGAVESRLQVASSQLAVSDQVLREAESRIRDVDVALEVAKLTRLNILQQAGTAVLAQANQAPSLVLQLLE